MNPASPSQKTSSTGFYFPCLDSIRGVAILLVVIFHAFSFDSRSFAQGVAVKLIQAGSLGVPLFFVLSGFLISLIVIHDPATFSWKTYALRRVAKIVPPFVLSLALYAVIMAHHGQLSGRTWLFAANLATLPNFARGLDLINPVSWSLFVEIHFYLLLPLVFFGWRRFFPRQAELLTIATLWIPATLLRAASWWMPATGLAERFFLLYRFPNGMDYFAWRMTFACLFRRYRAKWESSATGPRLALGGVALLVATIATFAASTILARVEDHIASAPVHELNRFLICLTAFLLLFTTTVRKGQPGSRFFGNKLLNYTGLISYEWFLFHCPIISWLHYHLTTALHWPVEPQNPDGTVTIWRLLSFVGANLIGIAASFLVAALIFEFFSKPIMKALRK